jgi:DNA-binding transcriptional ArsR family regulator
MVGGMIGYRERTARLFRALADETRLRLLAELATRGEVTCGEFAALCACSNSTLTYHQRILSEAGLLAVRRAGQYRVLSLQRQVLEELLPGFLDRLVDAERAALAGAAMPGS